MSVQSIYLMGDIAYTVGAFCDRNFEVGEIATVFFTAAREDWFAIFDTEGTMRVMVNPANVIEVNIA